ncbi:nucleotidyltransferase domain-containing protein [bacterium]|nr:nucleotidyltransferase domain-containing protein [bacterium]
MIHLDPQHLKLIKNILSHHLPDYEIWAFGSRVHGRQLKPFSDLDLVVKTESPLESSILFNLKEAFSESNLPIFVDVVDWAAIDDPFKDIILADFEIIQSNKIDYQVE